MTSEQQQAKICVHRCLHGLQTCFRGHKVTFSKEITQLTKKVSENTFRERRAKSCLQNVYRSRNDCLQNVYALQARFGGHIMYFLCVNVYSCKQSCFLTPKTHSKSGKQQFVNILYTFCKQFVPSSYTGCVRNIMMCKQFVHRLCKKSNITH